MIPTNLMRFEMKHSKLLKKLAEIMDLTYLDVNCAYAKWDAQALIPLILSGDKLAIELAKTFDWYGKVKVSCCKKFKDREEMNPFEKLIDNVKLMAWVVSKIGSYEAAEIALKKLKD